MPTGLAASVISLISSSIIPAPVSLPISWAFFALLGNETFGSSRTARAWLACWGPGKKDAEMAAGPSRSNAHVLAAPWDRGWASCWKVGNGLGSPRIGYQTRPLSCVLSEIYWVWPLPWPPVSGWILPSIDTTTCQLTPNSIFTACF